MTRHISLRTLYSIGFIFSLHTALILYSNSSFLEQFIPESYLGLLYSLGSVIAIFGVIMVPKMISRFGSKRTMLLLIITTVSICLVNAFVNNPYVIAAVFVILFSVNIMFFLSNDIIIDQVADQDSMGKTRGTYLTALNMGYVIAPTITGFVLARMGFSALYVIAAVILVPLMILVVSSQSYSHVHISKTQIWRDLGKLFKSRDLRNIVIANFLLQFFYAWMVIYTPVYLHEVLLVPWDTIGHLFSVMLLAFILTQIPLGRIADRRFLALLVQTM
jgi:MFS family permease